jgi:hypothetical protein
MSMLNTAICSRSKIGIELEGKSRIVPLKVLKIVVHGLIGE